MPSQSTVMSGASGGKHWSTRVKEATVAAHVQDNFLSLPVKGGADSGTFCFLGEINNKKIVYWSGKLHADYIVIEVQGYKVSGYTLRDVKELIETLSRNSEPILLKMVKPGMLPKDLKTYLSSRFKKGSPDYELQQTIRDNLYLRTVPCTTRPPREGEVNDVDYTFLSVDEFLALEKSGNLLESGIYEGNHYGTPKPRPEATGLYRKASGQIVNGPPDEGSSSSGPITHEMGGTLQRHRNKSTCEAVNATAASSSAKSTPAIQRRVTDGASGTSESLTDSTEPLPYNWEMAETEDGHKYFIDHNSGTTQWEDPRLEISRGKRNSGLDARPAEASGEEDEEELPLGWEKVDDPQYGVFFIDHINKHTQYERPSLSKRGSRKSLGDVKRTENGQGPQYALARPIFTSDPAKLRGQRVSTTLVKSPRGFGFTIVGGSDRSRPQFLQIKNVVVGGPAAVDSMLSTGDVLVYVNGVCVLGYTHADMVSMFQRIPVGDNLTLTVCKGYSLPFDPDDPDTEVITTLAVSPGAQSGNQNNAAAAAAPDVRHSMGEEEPDGTLARVMPRPPAPFLSSPGQRQTSRTSSESISSGVTSNTNSGPTTSTPGGTGPGNSSVFFLPRPEHTPRPEFIKATIMKSSTGFGFTIADSPQGQKVKQILDRTRCRTLVEGDLLVEINDMRVKEMAHNEVVLVLKECPVNSETRILIQRGGILSAAATSNSVTVTSPVSSSGLAASFEAKLSVSASVGLGPLPPRSTFHASGFRPLPPPSAAVTVTAPHAVATSLSSPPTASLAASVASPLATFQSRMQEEERRASTLTHSRYRSRTPGPEWGRTHVEMEAAHLPNRPKTPTALELRASRATPTSSSAYGGVGTSAELNYGSLLRGTRVALPNSQSFPASMAADRPASMLLSPAAAAVAAPAPGQEFFTFLRRGTTGFGFRIVGGAEEGSQVSIGHIVAGGPAEAEGRIRQGDEIVSIDNVSVLDATHRRVVQLMESASATGRVALGLRRPRIRYPYDVTVVRRETEGFGFVIISSANRQGSCIGRLVENSPAERCGQLHVGDRILAVNKVDISNMHHEDVVTIIKESGLRVTLTIGAPSAPGGGPTNPTTATTPRRTSLGNQTWRPQGNAQGPALVRATAQPSFGRGPVPGEEFEVTLHRGGRGFGFSIRGGQEFNQMPLYVLRIAEGGAAHEDGRLKIGDQILSINGRPTAGMSHSQAIEIIQSGGNQIRLLARRPLPSLGPLPHVPSLPAQISYTTDSELSGNKPQFFMNGGIPQARSVNFDRHWMNQRPPY